MLAPFIGGPYDGRSFTPEETNRHAKVFSTSVGGQLVSFLLMPPPELWGKDHEDGSIPTFHPYELVRLADGSVEFHDASENGRLKEVMEKGLAENK